MVTGMLLVTVVLVWFTISLQRIPAWNAKLSALLGDLMARDALSTRVLMVLSIGFMGAVFLLTIRVFTADVYYQAYLLRLSPVLIFCSLVIIQTIFILLWQLPSHKRVEWLWSLLFAGVLIFFQELPLVTFHKLNDILPALVIFLTTVLAQGLFRQDFQVSPNKHTPWFIAVLSVGMFLWMEWYFIPRNSVFYRQNLFAFAPTILAGLVVCTKLIDKFLSVIKRNRWAHLFIRLIILAGLLYAGNLYYLAGSAHAKEVNTTYAPIDDEDAYIGFAIKARETNFQFTGTRNQMPVYPFIQSLFYQSGMSIEEFFTLGKQVNIVLSLLCLAVLFIVFQKFLPLYQAVILVFATAFGLYVFKSGYFMSELLYYSLGALTFLFLGFLLIRPSIKLSICAGLLLGVAHMTKASALPALLLFLGVFAVKELFTALLQWKNGLPDSGRGQPGVKLRLASLVMVVIGFLAVTAPYGIESKRIYGSFFYNVNSTFYMWNDSYEESIAGPIAHGDSVGWPVMRSEDIPSPGKYFRDHNLAQIENRILYGIEMQKVNILNQYSVFNYPILFLAYTTVLFFIGIKRNLPIVKKYFPLVVFALLYFTSYTGLYVWYSVISCTPRFIYGLYVPLLISSYTVSKALEGDINLPLIKLMNMTVFALILIDIWYLVSMGTINLDYGA